VERGFADTCRDGVRKKAKYLTDVPEDGTKLAGLNSIKAKKRDPQELPPPARSGSKLKTELKAEPEQIELGKSTTTISVIVPPDQLHQHTFPTPQEPPKGLLPYSVQSHQNNDNLIFSTATHAATASSEPKIFPKRGWAADPGSPQPPQHSSTSNPGDGSNNNKQFQSVSANLEYSLIGNIISNKPTTHLHATSPYIDAARSSVSPSSFTASEDRSPQQQLQQHPHHHHQPQPEPNLRMPVSNANLNQYTLAYNPSATAHGQTFSEVLEAVETIENIQNKQNQNLHEWQLENAKNPKRPISFTIAKSPGGSTINNAINNNTNNSSNINPNNSSNFNSNMNNHNSGSGFGNGSMGTAGYGSNGNLNLAMYGTRNSYDTDPAPSLHNNQYFTQHQQVSQHQQQYQDRTFTEPQQQLTKLSHLDRRQQSVGANGFLNSRSWDIEPADIYARVTQPYSYTSEYHQLTMYIRARFSHEDQLKIAKCIASYRPSFIACTNTLKEDDLIFMERCFQRTLMEYEKYISFSGTPTVVWRRTGQIAAVGREFCILTGWPLERLLSDNTFIVELMDDESALEYFEIFSSMAFGDSIGANMTECTLLTPQGKRIKTTSIWTLKRDVFGIPMMIIGNFLPILK
jgi:PAS domain-containing protein